ncbi:Rv3235 family protein [Isoptericola chiayiensis]|uniref:Rv3235 family protein n=1 Tax=Isoptericola chiayiensis TaxID=579446 RepID=UPI001FE999C9|nr:Rv3235 family protein [Isoptericola chiayiensis]NOV99275.1 hypothetical protein [Isoptericola chiayiensis]
MTATTPESTPAGTDERRETPRRLRVTAPPRDRRPGAPPRAPRRPGPVRRVRVGGPTTTPAGDRTTGRPVPTQDPAADTRLPDPTALCCAVVRAAVDVLRGSRAPSQIARWVSPTVHDQLAERARLTRPTADGTVPPPVTVRRVRMVRLGDTTAEATVVLDDAGRVRAAAVRLEARRGIWRVTVLELG